MPSRLWHVQYINSFRTWHERKKKEDKNRFCGFLSPHRSPPGQEAISQKFLLRFRESVPRGEKSFRHVLTIAISCTTSEDISPLKLNELERKKYQFPSTRRGKPCCEREEAYIDVFLAFLTNGEHKATLESHLGTQAKSHARLSTYAEKACFSFEK